MFNRFNITSFVFCLMAGFSSLLAQTLSINPGALDIVEPDFNQAKHLLDYSKLKVDLRYNDIGHVEELREKVIFNDEEVYPELKISFKLTLNDKVDEDNITPLESHEFSLVSSYTNPEATFVFDIQDLIPLGLNHATLEFVSVESPFDDAKENRLLSKMEASFREDSRYGIDVINQNTNERIGVDNFSVKTPTDVTNERQVIFSWESQTEYPHYELEIYKINPLFEQVGIVDEIPFNTSIDWRSALKIYVYDRDETSSMVSYGLNMAQSGHYIWRVRPVGTFYENTFGDARNFGAWSIDQGDTDYLEVNETMFSTGFVFEFVDPEENKNFSFQRVITEQGTINESMNYATSLAQVVQNQTFISSNDKDATNDEDENTLLLSQTILDYQGRPSMTTLPVPIDGKLETYKSNVVKNEDDAVYTADDYDKDIDPNAAINSNFLNPNKVSGEAYEYYNGSEDHPDIASAEGYPYTRTIYMNDGTSRVKKAAGVGATHRAGSGHEVEYIYTQPSDNELVRVFGEEALPNESVLKVVTIDPNERRTVSYTTNEGTMIASALVFDSEEQGVEFDAGYTSFEQKEVLIQNTPVIDDNGNKVYSSKKDFYVSRPTNLDFLYEFNCDETELLGCELLPNLGSCGLRMQISILDEEGNEVLRSVETDVNCNQKINIKYCHVEEGEDIGDCVEDVDGVAWEQDLPNKIEEGRYTIVKKLKITADPDDDLIGRLSTRSDVLEKVAAVMYGWLEEAVSDEDMLNFYESVANLGAEIDKIREDEVLGADVIVFDFDSEAFPEEYLESGFYPSGAFDLVLSKDEVDVIKKLSFDKDHKIALPDFLLIESECCGEITIPLGYKPAFVCPDDPADITVDLPLAFIEHLDNNIILNTDLNPVFADALDALDDEDEAGIAELVEKQQNEMFAELFPGYTRTTMQYTLYKMMTDQYETEEGVVDQYQYSCQQLWDCWQATSLNYEDMAGAFAGEEINVREGNSDQEGEDAEGGSPEEEESSSENQEDEANEEGDKSAFLTFIMKLYGVEDKITEELQNQDDKVITLEYNFVDQFMKCAGYRFAKIITWEEREPLEADMNNDKGGDILLDDMITHDPRNFGLLDNYYGVYREVEIDDQGTIGFEAIDLESDIASPATDQETNIDIADNVGYYHKGMRDEDGMVYPYIKNPIYIYKYYEYGKVYPIFDKSNFPTSITETEENKGFEVLLEIDPIIWDQCEEIAPTTTTETPPVADEQLFYYTDVSPQEETKRWFGNELSTCFIDYEARLRSGEANGCNRPDADLCLNPCTEKGEYTTWKGFKLLLFYDMITADQTETFVAIIGATPPADEILDEEVEAIADNMIAGCNNSCELKRDEVELKVREMFLFNCYNNGDCASEENGIFTNAEVAEIVEGIISDCHTKCDGLITESNATPDCAGIVGEAYPCVQHGYTCHSVKGDGSYTAELGGIDRPIILHDCQQQVYDQIFGWQVEVHLDGLQSRCGEDLLPEVPEWLSGDDPVVCPEVEGEEKDYAAPNVLNADASID